MDFILDNKRQFVASSNCDTLLEILKLKHIGLSSERIEELFQEQGDAGLMTPKPARKPGSVEVWSHVIIDEGVELMIEPTRIDSSQVQVGGLPQADFECQNHPVGISQEKRHPSMWNKLSY